MSDIDWKALGLPEPTPIEDAREEAIAELLVTGKVDLSIPGLEIVVEFPDR